MTKRIVLKNILKNHFMLDNHSVNVLNIKEPLYRNLHKWEYKIRHIDRHTSQMTMPTGNCSLPASR